MAHLDDLENRLAQCRKAMESVLENLNYIQGELDKERQKSQSMGQAAMGQVTMGQAPMGQAPMGQAPIGQTTIGQTQMGQTPIGQAPIGQATIGQTPMGQAPMEWSPNRQPMGQGPMNRPEIGQQQVGQAPTGYQNNDGTLANSQMYMSRSAKPLDNTYRYNSVQDTEPKSKEKNEAAGTSSAESIFGKNVMAIAASVLIFVSLILFATLIIPKLSDTAKFLLMLAVSIGITSFGLIKWFRNKESTFFLSVGACGVGAIYISLFLSNMYFKLIDDITLFILLLVWAAGVLVLSKYKKLLFELIGCMGIAISVTFGTVVCLGKANVGMYFVLSIYFMIGILAFMLYRMKDNVSYLVTNICALYCLLILTFGAVILNGAFEIDSWDGEIHTQDVMPIYIFLSIISIGLIIYNRIATDEKNKVWIGFIGGGYSIFLAINVSNIFEKEEVGIILNIILAVGTYVALQVHDRKILGFAKEAGMYFWEILLYIITIGAICDYNPVCPLIGFSIVSIGLTVFGFIANDKLAKLLGVVSNGLILCFGVSEPVMGLVAGMILFAAETAFLYFKNEQYDFATKIVSYLLFLFIIIEALCGFTGKEWIAENTTLTVVLVVLGVINTVALKSPYRKNWEVSEDDGASIITCNIVNACLMLLSLYVMCTRDNELEHWISVLMGILLFMINSYSLMKKDDVWAALYVGFKGTVLLVTILLSFKASGAILSIAVFVLAIVLIVIGFNFKTKGLRIYGLVIALVCAIKLVMIDITYQNTIGHAISFFISGILCFAISAIYSFVEKKYKNEMQADQ